MRREIITWSVAAGLVAIAFAGTVLALNASLYSAAGFVRGYLEAIARHDAAGAIELATPTVEHDDASDALLVPDAMGELTDIQLVSDIEHAGGLHTVEYSFVADGVAGQSSFEVRSSGTMLGLFLAWRFDSDPLAVIELTAPAGTVVVADGVELPAAADGESGRLLVFAPGVHRFSHESAFLSGETAPIPALQGGSVVPALVEVTPTERFTDAVQEQVDAYLDECATQQVLLPTGCPFGQEIGNRIATLPVWSIAEYPEVALDPGPTAANWQVTLARGLAHLVVDERSLFDGSISTRDEDVEFVATFLVTVPPNADEDDNGSDDALDEQVVVYPVY